MLQDLKSFISKKNEYVKNLELNEETEPFIQFLTKNFNVSDMFIKGLNESYKDLLENDMLNLNIFADPMYFPHVCDWFSGARFDEDDILKFVLGTNLPDCIIINFDMESYFEDCFGEEQTTNFDEICLKELNSKKEYFNKFDINIELKDELSKFLDDNLIEYIKYSEDNSTYFQNIIVSSKILYDISKDDKLIGLYKKYFANWSIYFDDDKQIAYLWYSMLGFEEEQSLEILNLYNFEEVNEALKEYLKLEYSPIPKDMIDNIKIYSEYVSNGTTAIDQILNAHETKEEVMF